MHIDLTDETGQLKEKDCLLLQKIVTYAAEKEQLQQNAEVSLVIVDNDAIQQLNKSYRQKDNATDVLSFPMVEDFNQVDERLPLMIGDIIISIDKVKEQAERYNHPFERELAFLAIHGFLHLIGYTHDDEEEEKIMFGKQEQILQEFQLERG
ncbi:MAG TPA: rRNA maturation RNase YbeY [Candidatus Pseudogracilibacillus intestinigallinarum]|uniref:Endoribonuclease YbeY n=1 Tax=Candidatus Pseudogracilibacillus intestinigallinarum TaxID=2838742 RepID=A0A9D1PLK2_9BACI|nr:rRNA maturation RNase YbeY [Candidatus Pseudogracilibacillus intestinigallinarum]